MRYTPGPWKIAKDNCHSGQIATCHGDKDGFYEVWSRNWINSGIDQKANATLIAAAPDMLGALEEIANFHIESHEDAACMAEIAIEAIAKARGES